MSAKVTKASEAAIKRELERVRVLIEETNAQLADARAELTRLALVRARLEKESVRWRQFAHIQWSKVFWLLSRLRGQ